MSLWNSIIPDWWTENGLNGNVFTPGDGRLADRVWVSNRCIQMNSQQIASMPLRFEAPNAPTATQPAWCSNPDPHWFPSGISDAIFAIVAQVCDSAAKLTGSIQLSTSASAFVAREC